MGGTMTKIIPRGTIILANNLSTFTTYQNNKHAAIIKIFEAEKAMTK